MTKGNHIPQQPQGVTCNFGLALHNTLLETLGILTLKGQWTKTLVLRIQQPVNVSQCSLWRHIANHVTHYGHHHQESGQQVCFEVCSMEELFFKFWQIIEVVNFSGSMLPTEKKFLLQLFSSLLFIFIIWNLHNMFLMFPPLFCK